MKMKIVTIGVFMAMASATAFADDAEAQMNGQMGQTQATAPAAPAMPVTAMPNTQTTTANTQATTQAPAQAPQTGAMPDTATGSADDINTPSSNY